MQPWFRALRNLTWLTQLGFSLVAPPILCVGGCWWLQQRFSMGGWIVVVGLILGLGGSVSTAMGFYRHACRQPQKNQKKRPDAFNTHK